MMPAVVTYRLGKTSFTCKLKNSVSSRRVPACVRSREISSARHQQDLLSRRRLRSMFSQAIASVAQTRSRRDAAGCRLRILLTPAIPEGLGSESDRLEAL